MFFIQLTWLPIFLYKLMLPLSTHQNIPIPGSDMSIRESSYLHANIWAALQQLQKWSMNFSNTVVYVAHLSYKYSLFYLVSYITS